MNTTLTFKARLLWPQAALKFHNEYLAYTEFDNPVNAFAFTKWFVTLRWS